MHSDWLALKEYSLASQSERVPQSQIFSFFMLRWPDFLTASTVPIYHEIINEGAT